MFKEISYTEAVNFLLPKHYSGRKPVIQKAFGAFIEEELKAVCTFGKPASDSVCRGICGAEFKDKVFELNRLCRTDDYKEPLSKFVGWCLRELKALNWIIISYSDTAMNHHGYIYQACNFIYTGATKKRTDPFNGNLKHSRHIKCNTKLRQIRSSKHRYVYFCSDRRTIKLYKKNFKWKSLCYPKGENSNYQLGFVLKPQIVEEGELWNETI